MFPAHDKNNIKLKVIISQYNLRIARFKLNSHVILKREIKTVEDIAEHLAISKSLTKVYLPVCGGTEGRGVLCSVLCFSESRLFLHLFV